MSTSAFASKNGGYLLNNQLANELNVFREKEATIKAVFAGLMQRASNISEEFRQSLHPDGNEFVKLLISEATNFARMDESLVAASLEPATAQIRALEAQIREHQDRHSTNDSDIDRLKADVNDKDKAIQTLETNYNDKFREQAARIKTLEKQKQENQSQLSTNDSVVENLKADANGKDKAIETLKKDYNTDIRKRNTRIEALEKEKQEHLSDVLTMRCRTGTRVEF